MKIDFCIVSSDLFSDVLDVRVKRGAELSTDHHLVVCSLRLSKPWPNKRSNRSSVTYRIKWEALEDKQVRKQFASSISSKYSLVNASVSSCVEVWQNSQRLANRCDYFDIQERRSQAMYELQRDITP